MSCLNAILAFRVAIFIESEDYISLTTSELTRITFVRHGQVHNPEQVIYGRLPGFRLSALGERQAEAAAVALRDEPLAVVFSSPLLRAQQTAKILLAERPDVPLLTSELINEVSFLFEGQPMASMASRNWDLYTGVGPEYDQPLDVVARVRTIPGSGSTRLRRAARRRRHARGRDRVHDAVGFRRRSDSRQQAHVGRARAG